MSKRKSTECIIENNGRKLHIKQDENTQNKVRIEQQDGLAGYQDRHKVKAWTKTEWNSRTDCQEKMAGRARNVCKKIRNSMKKRRKKRRKAGKDSYTMQIMPI